MGSTVTGKAIQAIRDFPMTPTEAVKPGSAESFGSLVFNDSVQEKRLAKPAYQALQRTIRDGAPGTAKAASRKGKVVKNWPLRADRRRISAVQTNS